MKPKQLRYLQIADTLRTKIREGFYAKGTVLPSQKELADSFSTSVMTIRGALAQLNQEGIVNIVHGVGTFVATTGLRQSAIGLQGFQHEMDTLRRPITNTILSVEHDIVDDRLVELFHTEESVFSCLTRLRHLGSTPVILQRSYVVGSNGPIFAAYRADHSLYEHLSSKTGQLITQGKEIVQPIVLKEPELGLLGLCGEATAFLSQRVSITMDDVVVLYDEAYLAGPYAIMALRKLGRTSVSKYIINNNGTADVFDSFRDGDLWEDLL